MRPLIFKLLGLSTILLSVLIFAAVSVTPTLAQTPVTPKPIVGPLVHPSSFTGDLRQVRQVVPQNRMDALPLSPAPRQPLQSTQSDPVRQSAPASFKMPSPVMNFDGLNMSNMPSPRIPPDANGDVNANYYVQAVIMGIGIFDKATGALVVTTTIQSLWSTGYPTPTTPCDMNPVEDPEVLFDAIAQRWVITEMAWNYAFPAEPVDFYQCVAVSKTSNPVSGGWWFYPFKIETNQQIDYTKLGIWSDGYYFSSNEFVPYSQANPSPPFLGVAVWALDRAKLITGAATSFQKFWLPCGTFCYKSLLPSNLRGANPPNGTPSFFASIDTGFSDVLNLWRFHVDWTTPSNSWFGSSSSITAPLTLTVASYTGVTDPFGQIVPQNSTTQTHLQSFADRLMMHLEYRNIGGVESLWANHSVYDNGILGIRWYEIRNPNGAPTVYQQGTYQPNDGVWRWMGSLAVDHDGNMALGYSASNASMFPAIRYTGRLVTETLGTLGQAEQVLYQGPGPESDPSGWGTWGDYSGMIIDPIDGCTFWYTSEYFGTTTNEWRTRIGSFKYPSCTPNPGLSLYLPLIKR